MMDMQTKQLTPSLRISNDGNGLAEVIGSGQFHLHRMDRGYWWIRFVDEQGKSVVVKLKGRIDASHEVT